MSGVVIPVLANVFRKRVGSYAPLFILCAAMEATGGLLFGKLASVSVARNLVASRGVTITLDTVDIDDNCNKKNSNTP